MIPVNMKTTQFWVWAILGHVLLFAVVYHQWHFKPTSHIQMTQQPSEPMEIASMETQLFDEQWVQEEVVRLEQAEQAEQEAQQQALDLAAKQAMQLEKLKAEVHQLQQEKVEQANQWAEKAKQLAEKKAKVQDKAREAAMAEFQKKQQAAQQAQQAKQAQAKIEAERKQQAIAALKEKIDAEKMIQSAQGEVEDSIAKIIQKVSQRWTRPVGDMSQLSCQLSVKVLPTGVVQSVSILQPSGHALFDRSASTAVMKASPLPLPENRVARQNLREFTFTFYPHKD